MKIKDGKGRRGLGPSKGSEPGEIYKSLIQILNRWQDGREAPREALSLVAKLTGFGARPPAPYSATLGEKRA